ncbi:GNAT family N-acetyltransferase [Saccharomonospora cyanea]|uniref:Acetyltransferase n=1 Tax=Saccharomonospora cyanea NA-134 TaxID=882082 RepID=H5XQE0_9PSEU|nr:GNAT family N-acetyltransferase [Saccharomonospora cyanea]EHR63873.1 acetyltransferase [Saccharomonospora cyanea NA-134]
MTVSLLPVTRDNVRAVCELRLAEGQEHLVAPAAYTVAEGNYEPDAVLHAIHLDDVVVGVLLVEVETGVPYLVRFMVDASYQGRGVGRQAVELLVEELRGQGWVSVETTFVPGDGSAEGFWRRCGFRDTGRTRYGEPVYVRDLTGEVAEPVPPSPG